LLTLVLICEQAIRTVGVIFRAQRLCRRYGWSWCHRIHWLTWSHGSTRYVGLHGSCQTCLFLVSLSAFLTMVIANF